MSATLKVTHKTIGAEVRRGTYDVPLDGERVGSVEMNETYERPVEPGRHTLQVRNGRNSSRTKTFDAADGEAIAFRATGKSTADLSRVLRRPQPGAQPQTRVNRPRKPQPRRLWKRRAAGAHRTPPPQGH
jgi:hypothetical protein